MYAERVSDGLYKDHTPGSALSPGDVVVEGDSCYVCERDVAADTKCGLAATGVFRVAKQAALAITAGDSLYWDAAANEVDKTSSNVYFGKAFDDAAADDTTVLARLIAPEVREAAALGDLSDVGDTTATAGNVLVGDGSDFVAGKLDVNSLGTTASGAAGVPYMIRTVCTAAGDEDEIVLASADTKLQILLAWMISRDTNAANVTLHQGTLGSDDITSAKAKGSTDDAIVMFDDIIAEQDEVAAAADIQARISAAASVEICLLVLPIA